MYSTSIKFRAFQLDTPGSLFSLYKDDTYTLIEARIPKGGLEVLQQDLKMHGKERIDLLHITSWDTDHCNSEDLQQIINHLRPAVIEYPAYFAESKDGQYCQRLVLGYDRIHQPAVLNRRPITKEYLQKLSIAQPWQHRDIIYEPCYNRDIKNDMSLIKLFRSQGFSVLSLGDCESPDIAKRLLTCPIIRSEVDVLILPHHGADNGFITGELLDIITPKIAICSSNNCNQYEHPHSAIVGMLQYRNIPLYTTKRGDAIVFMKDAHQDVQTLSLYADNTKVEKEGLFKPKRRSA